MAETAADVAQRILGIARTRADAAEVLYQESEGGSVHFQDNRLKSVNTKAVRGVGLRVIHKGRLGFSCTTDLDSLDELVSRALDSAAFGQEAKFEFPSDAPEAKVKQFDARVAELSMERAAGITRQGISYILEAFPEAHCGGGIQRDMGRGVLCNTAGLHHDEESSDFGMGLSALLVRGESFLWVDEGEDSCRFSGDILRHARKAVDWVRLCEKEVHLPGEKMPVVFTAKALGFLLATFEANTNGKTVQKGASVLSERLGERVLDRRVTIWDDPHVDYAVGSCDADAEGVAAQRKAIFEKGVLQRFIYDLQTAGMMGTASTGNGMRGYTSQPHPGITNIRFAPGDTPYAEMLAGLRRGLLIDQALGAGQSNMLAGDFSVNVELGFLVENGEVVGRAKDCMVAGNVFEAFNSIRQIGSEPEWHGSAELPAVCFDALSIVGRKQ